MKSDRIKKLIELGYSEKESVKIAERIFVPLLKKENKLVFFTTHFN